MKKIYQSPSMRIVFVSQMVHLMAGSGPEASTMRFDEGGPTQYGLPTDIGSTSAAPVQDMFGKGQDAGSIRSREFWDDF